MASVSIGGQRGQLSAVAGWGHMAAALSGHAFLTGWPDREPTMPSSVVYGDAITPVFTTAALLGALDYRSATGRGQYLDISQIDVLVHLLTPAFADLLLHGRIASRMGNRSPYACPHGVFSTIEPVRWCTIAVESDTQWRSLCTALEMPDLAGDPRFSTLAARKAREDQIEAIITKVTRTLSPHDIWRRLSSAGVPSSVVQDAEDLLDRCPQLKHRRYFVKRKHPVIGWSNHPSEPAKLSRTPAAIRTSPLLGQHTYAVCKNVLRLTDEEFADLAHQGVFE